MLYMVTIKIHWAAVPEDRAAEIIAAEVAHAKDLIVKKKPIAAYRKVGNNSSFWLIDAESNDEVPQILSGLPVRRYLDRTYAQWP